MFLHVKVIEARDVPKMDTFSMSDPYCRVDHSPSGATWQTEVIKDATNPVWSQCEFHIPLVDTGNDSVTFTIYDSDDIDKDDPISSATIRTSSLVEGRVTDEWLEMVPSPGVKNVKQKPKIHITHHLGVNGRLPFKEY
jgi:Ca2+-dependent lipid-binding protein